MNLQVRRAVQKVIQSLRSQPSASAKCTTSALMISNSTKSSQESIIDLGSESVLNSSKLSNAVGINLLADLQSDSEFSGSQEKQNGDQKMEERNNEDLGDTIIKTQHIYNLYTFIKSTLLFYAYIPPIFQVLALKNRCFCRKLTTYHLKF